LNGTEIRFRPGLDPSRTPVGELTTLLDSPDSPPLSFGASKVFTPLFYGWRRPCAQLYQILFLLLFYLLTYLLTN